MAGYLIAKFLFCIFKDQDEVEVHNNTIIENEANIQVS